MKVFKVIIAAVWVIAGIAILSSRHASAGGDNGKDLFKQNCKVCHEKDSPNGEFTPMSLTQDQWKSFFKSKLEPRHKDVVLEKEKKKLLEFLTPAQVKTIEKFCVDHAADSEQPQTCSD